MCTCLVRARLEPSNVPLDYTQGGTVAQYCPTWVIPCQINTKKYLTSQIWTKLGSYIVPVETFTHSQFQCYMLYGFRVRAS